MNMNRRKFLAASVLGGVTSVSGCVVLEPIDDVSEFVTVRSMESERELFEDVELLRAFVSDGLLRGVEYVLEFAVETCECSGIDSVRVESEYEVNRESREMMVFGESVLMQSMSNQGFQTDVFIEGLVDGEVVDVMHVVLEYEDSVVTA